MKSDMITTCLVLGFLYAGSHTCRGTYQLSKNITRSGYTILRRSEEVAIFYCIQICFDCLCAASSSILLLKLRRTPRGLLSTRKRVWQKLTLDSFFVSKYMCRDTCESAQFLCFNTHTQTTWSQKPFFLNILRTSSIETKFQRRILEFIKGERMHSVIGEQEKLTSSAS